MSQVQSWETIFLGDNRFPSGIVVLFGYSTQVWLALSKFQWTAAELASYLLLTRHFSLMMKVYAMCVEARLSKVN